MGELRGSDKFEGGIETSTSRSCMPLSDYLSALLCQGHFQGHGMLGRPQRPRDPDNSGMRLSPGPARLDPVRAIHGRSDAEFADWADGGEQGDGDARSWLDRALIYEQESHPRFVQPPRDAGLPPERAAHARGYRDRLCCILGGSSRMRKYNTVGVVTPGNLLNRPLPTPIQARRKADVGSRMWRSRASMPPRVGRQGGLDGASSPAKAARECTGEIINFCLCQSFLTRCGAATNGWFVRGLRPGGLVFGTSGSSVMITKLPNAARVSSMVIRSSANYSKLTADFPEPLSQPERESGARRATASGTAGFRAPSTALQISLGMLALWRPCSSM